MKPISMIVETLNPPARIYQGARMSNYLPIRKSQIYHYLKTPLYVKNSSGDFVLYKSEGAKIDLKRFSDDQFPQLFIPSEKEEFALVEVQTQLIKKLKDRVKSGDLLSIKSALCEIVNEVFQKPLGNDVQILPETIDIIYNEYSTISKLLRNVEGVQFGGTTLVEHSVNVMVLVLNFCIFSRLDYDEAKKVSLGALLHDIGLTKVPRTLIESSRKLSESEFEMYKSHPSLGHDIIMENEHIDSSISKGVLEHHERLDGNGYPRGISNISFEGCLIGMFDSFDNLTCTEKEHRKREDPFSALRIIQKEILTDGKFDKTIFRDACLSLLGKKQYTG